MGGQENFSEVDGAAVGQENFVAVTSVYTGFLSILHFLFLFPFLQLVKSQRVFAINGWMSSGQRVSWQKISMYSVDEVYGGLCFTPEVRSRRRNELH